MPKEKNSKKHTGLPHLVEEPAWDTPPSDNNTINNLKKEKRCNERGIDEDRDNGGPTAVTSPLGI
jgi:hypothetical protein